MPASRKAATVESYLQSLPPARRAALEQVRTVIRKNLPDGYQETLTKGLITWVVPLSAYPTTYNGHALWYVALGAQKNYLSLYLMAAYASASLTRRLQDGFRQAGKRLDMGRSCIHFKDAGDLALDVIGDVVAAVPMQTYIATAEAARSGRLR